MSVGDIRRLRQIFGISEKPIEFRDCNDAKIRQANMFKAKNAHRGPFRIVRYASVRHKNERERAKWSISR